MIALLLTGVLFFHTPAQVVDSWVGPPTLEQMAEYLAVRAYYDTQPYRGMGSDVEQWRPLVVASFPADQVDRALCILRWESGGNPDAKNPISSARGLFQILASLWAPHFGVTYDALYDPETNVRLAAEIWRSQGWGAWTVWLRGLCR